MHSLKSFIFCTSFVSPLKSSNNLERYKRWVEFYSPKLSLFDAEALFLIDDGSPQIAIENAGIFDVTGLPDKIENVVNVFRFENNLGRPSQRDYRGWWRSFTYSVILARHYNFDKIIHLESDFFTLTADLIAYIRELDSGWTTFYSDYHQFPESAMQIICKDQYGKLMECYDEVFKRNYQMDVVAERYFPFTNVNKKFRGDRLGQFDVLDGWLSVIKPPLKLDYIGQILPDFKAEDFADFFDFDFKWQ
jgi:hypothetical protein